MAGIRLKVLLFAAALLIYTQCLSACTFAPCQAQKSCHQTETKPCSHESLASPGKVWTGDESPVAISAPPPVPTPEPVAAEPPPTPTLQTSPPLPRVAVLRL